jgi:PTH1 family peptidyl-tRNA hydrolase
VKLFVGLGNPGSRYVGSRHNIGFRIALEFGQARGVAIDEQRFEGVFGAGLVGRDLRTPVALAAGVDPAETLAFLLPLTFVNASGRAVGAVLEAFPALDPERDLLVAYDDLDLPLGRIRLRPGGGPGGHNGMASIIDVLGTKQFARVRFGVGRPPDGLSVTDFVLGRFSDEEEEVLSPQVVRACEAAAAVFREGIVTAMDRFNSNQTS